MALIATTVAITSRLKSVHITLKLVTIQNKTLEMWMVKSITGLNISKRGEINTQKETCPFHGFLLGHLIQVSEKSVIQNQIVRR